MAREQEEVDRKEEEERERLRREELDRKDMIVRMKVELAEVGEEVPAEPFFEAYLLFCVLPP